MLHLVTFTALSEFPDRLDAYFNALSPETRSWTPPSWDGCPGEQLTALERLSYCRDIEIDLYEIAINRAVTEDNPQLKSLDVSAFRAERAYANANPEEVLAVFRAARKRTLSILEGMKPEQWKRSAQVEGYGATTVLGLVHFLASHDEQQLAALQWLMGMVSAE